MLLPSSFEPFSPGLILRPESRFSATTTKRLLTILRDRNWYTNALRSIPIGKRASNHSSAVVAIDEQGNVAAVLHSCNCLLWGFEPEYS